MAVTLKQTEAIPASYPVTDPAVPDEVWQRLEAYIAHRWTSRAVVWLVEGCGEWVAPLTPATITAVEIWSDRAKDWEVTTLDASPGGGYFLPATGPYRFTATVGGGSPALPDVVARAAQRLAAYLGSATGSDLVTLAEAKEYLRVDYSDEDASIALFVTAASDEARLLTDESAAVRKAKALERIAELFDRRGEEQEPTVENPPIEKRPMARAMQNSGAADLLRYLRRA